MARTQKYEFSVRKGFHVKRETAERVGRLIVELTDKGIYSPEKLVEVASDPRCPAHTDFDWDDTTAAHQWRMAQARKYQQAITYTLLVTGPRGGKPKPMKLRAAYAFEDEVQHTYYRSGTEVVRNKDLLEDLKTRALAALESWRTQYNMLASIGEFAGVFREITRVTKVVKARKKPSAPAGASVKPPATAPRAREAARRGRPKKASPFGRPRSKTRELHA
jgi:hypothetical protein